WPGTRRPRVRCSWTSRAGEVPRSTRLRRPPTRWPDGSSWTSMPRPRPKLMDLDAATAAHGLAAPSGTFVDTGIGGLTLTGGISWILASEGFACDALIGARLVTIDGDVIDVDDQHEPELLWGLRGGGGN